MRIHTVQLNLADFDKGTSGLSPLEFTIYTRLFLAAYERTQPDNDEILARIARVEKKDIKKVRKMIEEKFKKVDGFFQNSRTELEKEKYKKISEKNKENAILELPDPTCVSRILSPSFAYLAKIHS